MRNPETMRVNWGSVDAVWKVLAPRLGAFTAPDDDTIRQAMNQAAPELGKDVNKAEAQRVFVIVKKRAHEEVQRRAMRDAARHERELTAGLPKEDEEAA